MNRILGRMVFIILLILCRGIYLKHNVSETDFIGKSQTSLVSVVLGIVTFPILNMPFPNFIRSDE